MEAISPILIPIKEIYSDPSFNCRGTINAGSVVELARNIDIHGLLQPIAVQPYTQHPPHKYRTVLGHRRLEAFKLLNKEEIPAVIKEGLTDLEARALNLIENLERSDLNLKQEADALVPFFRSGLTEQEVGKRIGKSIGWVHIRKIILRLPEDIQKEIAAGFITQDQVKSLSKMTRDQQVESVKQIKNSKIRGEKRALRIGTKKHNPLKTKRRDDYDIRAMIEHILDSVGPCLATRVLAWAAGEIPDIEVYRDIRDYAKTLNKNYAVPREVAGML
jgi:ParB family transcriptional regulator, chromosome partitioning protein